MLRSYQLCESLEKRAPSDAAGCFTKTADWAMRSNQSVAFAWLLMRAADIQSQGTRWPLAEEFYEKTLKNETELNPLVASRVFWNRYLLLSRHGNKAKATEYLYDALRESTKLGKDNVLSISVLGYLVRELWLENDLSRAENVPGRRLRNPNV